MKAGNEEYVVFLETGAADAWHRNSKAPELGALNKALSDNCVKLDPFVDVDGERLGDGFSLVAAKDCKLEPQKARAAIATLQKNEFAPLVTAAYVKPRGETP